MSFLDPEKRKALLERNAQIQAELDAMEAEVPPTPPKNPSFLESAKAGFLNTSSMGLKALGYATGSEDIKNAANQVGGWSEELAPQGPQDFTDLLAYYGVGAIPGIVGGALAGYAAPAVGITGAVGTGLASLGGAAVANYPILAGSNLQRQEQQNEGVVKDQGAAFLTAIPQAVADSIFDALVVTKVLNVGAKALKAGDKTGSIFTKIVKDGATGVAVEVPTEIGQQVLERAQAGLDLASPDAIEEYAEVAKVAGILGGTFGGAAGAIRQFNDVNEIKRLDLIAAADDARKKELEELTKQYAAQKEASGLSALKQNIESKFPALEYMGKKDASGNPIESDPIGAKYEYSQSLADRMAMFAEEEQGKTRFFSEPVFNLGALGTVGVEVDNYYKAMNMDLGGKLPLRLAKQLPQELRQKVYNVAQGVQQNPSSKKKDGKPYSERQLNSILEIDGDITPETVAKTARMFKKSTSEPFIEAPLSMYPDTDFSLPPFTLSPDAPPEVTVTPDLSPTPDVPQRNKRGRKGTKKQEQQTPVPQTAVPIIPELATAPAPAVSQEIVSPVVEKPVDNTARRQEVVAAKRENAQKTAAAPASDRDLVTRTFDEALASFTEEDAQRQAEARRAKEAAEAARPTVNQGSLPGRNTPGLAPTAQTSSFPFVDNPAAGQAMGAATDVRQTAPNTITNSTVLPALQAMGERMMAMIKLENRMANARSAEKNKLIREFNRAREVALDLYRKAVPDGDSAGFEAFMQRVRDEKRNVFADVAAAGNNQSEKIGTVSTGKPTDKPKGKPIGVERVKQIDEKAVAFMKGWQPYIVTTKDGKLSAMFFNPWGVLKVSNGVYRIFNAHPDFPEETKARFKKTNYATKELAARAVAENVINMGPLADFEMFLKRVPLESLHPSLHPKDNVETEAQKKAAKEMEKKPAASKTKTETKTEKKSEPKADKPAAEKKEPVKFTMDVTSYDTFAAGLKREAKETSVTPMKGTGLKPKTFTRGIEKNGAIYIQPMYVKTKEFPYGDTSKVSSYVVRIMGEKGNFGSNKKIKTLDEARKVAYKVAKGRVDTGTISRTPVNETPNPDKQSSTGWKATTYQGKREEPYRAMARGPWRIIKIEEGDYRVDNLDPKYPQAARMSGINLKHKSFKEAEDTVNIWSKPLEESAPKNQISTKGKPVIPQAIGEYDDNYMGPSADDEIELYSIKPGTELDPVAFAARKEGLNKARALLNKAKFEEKAAYQNANRVLRQTKDGTEFLAWEGVNSEALKNGRSSYKKARDIFEDLFPEDDGSSWDNFVEGKALNDPRQEPKVVLDELPKVAPPPEPKAETKAAPKARKKTVKEKRQESQPAIHFIGFDPNTDKSKFDRAVQIFGAPDFIHRKWDVRAKNGGEYAPGDIRIFAKGTEKDVADPNAFDDSAQDIIAFEKQEKKRKPRNKIVNPAPETQPPMPPGLTITSGMDPAPEVEETVASNEWRTRQMRAAVSRDYDTDAAKVLLEDLVARGIIERVGPNTFRKINQERKYEALATELEKQREASRISSAPQDKPATRLVFEVRQITNPDRVRLAEGSMFVLVDPKGNIVYQPGTLNPYTFKNAEDYKKKFSEEQAKYEKDGKAYFNYRQAVMRGEWPANQPRVEKPEPPKFVGKPVIAKYVKVAKDEPGEWIIDESANRWVVLRVGYGSDGRMISEKVESVRTKKEDAEADAAHYRKQAAGMGYSITDKDIQQAERMFAKMDLATGAPKTDAMKVVFAQRESPKLNVPPEQMVNIVGQEAKNSSRMPDSDLQKKYGDLFTAYQAVFNDVFGKTGLSNLGVTARIADLINNKPGIQGSYRNKLISVAFGATIDPKLNEQQNSARIASVMTHEVVHAFKSLGAFTDEDMRVLTDTVRTRKASNNQTYIQNAMRVYAQQLAPQNMIKNPAFIKRAVESIAKKNMNTTPETIAAEIQQMSQDIMIEEAIAEMAADWAGGKAMPQKVDGLFQKIMKFFKSLFKAGQLTNASDKIFEDMTNGNLAKRTRPINSIDGTRYSLKLPNDHVVLVHKVDKLWLNSGDPLKDQDIDFDSSFTNENYDVRATLQIVERSTGVEKARATARIIYEVVEDNLNGDPTAAIVRPSMTIDSIAAPWGENLSIAFVRSFGDAIKRKLKVLGAQGGRITGAKVENTGIEDQKQVIPFGRRREDINPSDEAALQGYDDAVIFSEEDFEEVSKFLQPDSDEVLKRYYQTGRLEEDTVNSMLREGVDIRQSIKDGVAIREELVRYRDKKDFAERLGFTDDQYDYLSIPQLLYVQDWVEKYLKRRLRPDEAESLVRLERPEFFDEILMNYGYGSPGSELALSMQWDSFVSTDYTGRANGFSGTPLSKDDNYTDELYSLKDIHDEDVLYARNADMGMDPFGNLNDGLGERLRPAASTNHQHMWERDYAYTITLRHMQAFANRMTPQMVKNTFGFTKDDVDLFVQKFYTSFIDANLPIAQVIDIIRKAGGYIDDRFDVYLQAELKSDEIIPEIERVRREHVEPIVQYMVENGISLADANDYLNAMHAPERNELIRKRREGELAKNLEDEITPSFDALYGSGTTEQQAYDALMALQAEGKVLVRNWVTDDGVELPDRLESYGGKLHEFGKLYQGLIAETNKIREMSGLIPPLTELIDGKNYPGFRYYAPLKSNEMLTGDENIDDQSKARVGVKYGVSGLEDKHATGRYTKASRIFENAVMQNYEAIIRGKRADVGRAFHEMVEANQDKMIPYVQRIADTGPMRKALTADGRIIKVADHRYKTDPRYFVTKINGKEVVYEFTDDGHGNLTPQAAALSRALRGFAKASDANSFVKGLQFVNQTLAKLNTAWNPEFTVTNLIRDLGLAMFNIGQYDLPAMQRQILFNWKPAYKTIRAYDPKNIKDEGYMKLKQDGTTFTDPRTWTDEEMYHALRSFGGLSSFYEKMDLNTVSAQLTEDMRVAAGVKTKPQAVLGTMKKIVGAVENWNTAIEHATRLSAFKAMLNQGVPLQRAAQATKNLTVNFNKGGEQRVLLNALYLFYNASIQGTMTMLNAIHRSPKLMKAAMYLTAAGFLADVANDALSDDEPDGTKSYDLLKQWKKESSLNIPMGGGQYFSIPLPWGLSFFWNLGRASSYGARTGDIVGATGSIMNGLVTNFSPIGSMENMANFFAPTILDPIINVATNTSWDGREIQPTNLPFGPQKPNSQLYWNSTSGTMKDTAALFNELTGGDENFPGIVDISPEILSYGVEFAMGGTGMFVLRGGDFFTENLPKIMSGDDWEWNDVPFFRRVVTGTSKRSTVETYSKNLEEVVMQENAFKQAAIAGDTEKAQAYLDEYGAGIAVAPVLKAIQSKRSDIKSTMKEVTKSKSLSSDEKARTLKQLRDAEMQLIYEANRIFKQRSGE